MEFTSPALTPSTCNPSQEAIAVVLPTIVAAATHGIPRMGIRRSAFVVIVESEKGSELDMMLGEGSNKMKQN